MSQIGEVMVQLSASTGAFTEAAEAALRAHQVLSDTFTRATRTLWRLIWRRRFAEYHRIGMTRPDGRPRRSGHRHRGTVGWERRHG